MDQRKEEKKIDLDALEKMAESDIDLSDAPELTNWDDVEQGKFYRPKTTLPEK